MQKLFNVMSVASFVMSGGMVIGSVMLYTRIPSMTKHYMLCRSAEHEGELTGNVTDMVPGQIDEALPELPTTTGPAVCQSSHHFSVGGWIVVMSFRPEAFSLDFCHIKFWRGSLRFLLKRRKPFA